DSNCSITDCCGEIADSNDLAREGRIANPELPWDFHRGMSICLVCNDGTKVSPGQVGDAQEGGQEN
ncbi:MAG: hypothetical protein ACUVWX_06985, partial [Kiritimatiellia bacterium]